MCSTTVALQMEEYKTFSYEVLRIDTNVAWTGEYQCWRGRKGIAGFLIPSSPLTQLTSRSQWLMKEPKPYCRNHELHSQHLKFRVNTLSTLSQDFAIWLFPLALTLTCIINVIAVQKPCILVMTWTRVSLMQHISLWSNWKGSDPCPHPPSDLQWSNGVIFSVIEILWG